MNKIAGALTYKQQETLDFLAAYTARHKRPPTLREVGAATGLASTSAVSYNLKALETAGLIERDEGTSRGIKLRILPGPTDPDKLYPPLTLDEANAIKQSIARLNPGVCALIQSHGHGFAVLVVAR